MLDGLHVLLEVLDIGRGYDCVQNIQQDKH